MKKIFVPLTVLFVSVATLVTLAILTVRELLKDFDGEMEEVVTSDYPGDENEDW